MGCCVGTNGGADDGGISYSKGTNNGSGGRQGEEGQRYVPSAPSSKPLPPPPPSNCPTYTAKYDYESRTDDDLTFQKGDLLYIISTEEGDWWYAQHRDTGEKGFIPSNYVAEHDSLDAEEWVSLSRFFADVLV